MKRLWVRRFSGKVAHAPVAVSRSRKADVAERPSP
jgi:hypothetical protein